MIKLFSDGSINYDLMAHYLIEHGNGYVLKNVYNAFFAIVEAMSERLESGNINDNDELRVAVVSQRIKDAMERYTEDA